MKSLLWGERLYRQILSIYKCLPAILFLFSVSAPAAADMPETNAAEPAAIRVAVMDYPYYFKMDHSGVVSGFAYEYLKEIQKYTGWNYEFVQMPFSEAMDALAAGNVDIVPGCQKTPEREARCDFSAENMGQGNTVLCVLPQNTAYTFGDIASFDGMRIAALKGSVRIRQTRELFATYGIHADFIEYDTDRETKDALENGVVDSILMSNTRCESQFRILAQLKTTPLYFAINNRRPEIKAGIDNAMTQIHLYNPYYEAVLDKQFYSVIERQTIISQEDLRYIQERGPVTIAVSADMKPLQYYDEKNGVYKGIIIDFLNELSARTGLIFRYVRREQLPVLQQQIKNGTVQAVATLISDSELTDFLNLSLTRPYFSNTVSMIMNLSIKDRANSKYRVILCEGYPLYKRLAHDMEYTDISYCRTFKECVDLVQKGTYDLTLIDTYTADSLTSHSYYTRINSMPLANSGYQFSIGVSRAESPRLASILSNAIDSIPEGLKNTLLINSIAGTMDDVNFYDFWLTNRAQVLGILAAVLALLIIMLISMIRTKTQSNRRLMEMVEHAQIANKAKSDFLSHMSHDMRTPMNGIQGMTILTLDLQDLPEEARRNLSAIYDSSKYLLNLINDTLDMNKIESQKIELQPEPVLVKEFIDRLTKSFIPTVKEKELTFTVTLSNSKFDYIMVDRLRLQQIFTNLLSNAVKFTPPHGSVALIVECTGRENSMTHTCITVRDSGIGMSPEFIARAFEPFEQEKNAINTAGVGTGLGLPIVKNLVQLMGGSIELRSELGKGTDVVVYLDFEHLADYKPAATVASDTATLQEKRLLLCEDNALNATIACKLLEKEGASVEIAANGSIGVEKFRESETGYYDAILMDIQMPVMNGLEAVQIIRTLERPDARSIPIVAMSANAFAADVSMSLAAGMNAHIAKPFDPDTLYKTLGRLLSDNG